MKNDSLKVIGQQLAKVNTVLIVTHINMDGDALGSAAAICGLLRKMGKTAYILIEDEIPANLAFMDRGFTTTDFDIVGAPDVSLCVDCGDSSRFPKRAERFMTGGTTICIDHHATTGALFDYNYVDPDAAAAAELIYQLILAMDQPIDKECGEAIFAAITTDTGNFQNANTTGQSHRIVADLIDRGIDSRSVSVELYENVRQAKLRIESIGMGRMTIHGQGQIAATYLTQEDFRESGAANDETDDIVGMLRSIQGVEVAIFLKETKEGKVRVSLRSKSWFDVAEIAGALGGGGHLRAAGCTLECEISQALDILVAKVMENLNKHDN